MRFSIKLFSSMFLFFLSTSLFFLSFDLSSQIRLIILLTILLLLLILFLPQQLLQQPLDLMLVHHFIFPPPISLSIQLLSLLSTFISSINSLIVFNHQLVDHSWELIQLILIDFLWLQFQFPYFQEVHLIRHPPPVSIISLTFSSPMVWSLLSQVLLLPNYWRYHLRFHNHRCYPHPHLLNHSSPSFSFHP